MCIRDRANDKTIKALKKFKNISSLKPYFKKARGYAVFPNVGKGGIGIGGARGSGEVFEKGNVIGKTTLTQVSIGFQLGGQAFSQIIFFKDKKIPFQFILKEKYKILLASILVTFAYLPILYAFTKVNVPSVAALREISILFTSIYGVYFLKEKFHSLFLEIPLEG